jgi:superfamily II DNA or RNA helicase
MPTAGHERDATQFNPRPGLFCYVRNRSGVITGVDPFDGDNGRVHLVHVEYKDDQLPDEAQLIWELEGPSARLLEPTALPDPWRSSPMPVEDFDALLRTARWTAAMPFLDPDGSGPLERLPIRSPFHSAVQVEDYQLVPLLKALRMPRVNLLLADDVGLGKTIEAGLILSELLIRRRIRRVLILTPASLRLQWRDEMWDKFSLRFNLVDRDETAALRRRLGMDANPWRSFARIIASYHYLRQDDVLDQFMAACDTPPGSPHLPWDLLIVDECHNLMPSPFGEDSDLCRMLRQLAPYFEHRLFLSATPHNGHTRSFTGLLEILDPVRFSQTDELKPAERSRVQQVVIRRLKREINARTDPPMFCTRLDPQALHLRLSQPELALTRAFADFRKAMRSYIAAGDRKRRRAGSFAVEILGKRLLSCPVAFAESWSRCREGLGEAQAAGEADVDAARRTVERDSGDDREAQSREAVAASVVGAWLQQARPYIEDEIDAIGRALADLGLNHEAGELTEHQPVADARFDALVALIEDRLRDNGVWRNDERLVVFTEYKTTLDYLARRLREAYEPERILTLYGGMDETDRDQIKQAFNDPAQPVRVLLGTDAASEGLNLQRTARYVLHYDCPWNPSKLEQRNGRLDRHGQARDVQIFHFMTDEDEDLRFLAHVLRKANDIREDLGSANELFDAATHRCLVDGEDAQTVQSDLEARLRQSHGRAVVEADATPATSDHDAISAARQIEALAAELDHDPDAVRDTLEAAMAVHAGRPQIEQAPEPATFKLVHPDLPGWAEIVDDSLRLSGYGNEHGILAGNGNRYSGARGPVARLAFSPQPFLDRIGERLVFTPRADVALLHLSHPMLDRAFATLTRCRFPGTGEEVSRWTVRCGSLPTSAEALIVLSVEELAVNELRETFHHWVRSIVFPILGARLGDPLPHQPALALRGGAPVRDSRLVEHAARLFDDVIPDLKNFLERYTEDLTTKLRWELEKAGEEARADEEERYRSRQGEISTLIQESTLAKLEREITRLKEERDRGSLFDEDARLDDLDRSIKDKQDEIERRRHHYEEVRKQLERERERIMRYLLPKRYSMPERARAQVLPVCVEIQLPEESQ